MNKAWIGACWDVVSKESLEKWYEVEDAINSTPSFFTLFSHLGFSEDLPEPDFSILFDYDSWDDYEDEWAESWYPINFKSKLMLTEGINASSMNQMLDEDLDFSVDTEYCFNLEEFLKNTPCQ